MTFGGCIMYLGRDIGTMGGTETMIGIVLVLKVSARSRGPFVFLSRTPLVTSTGFSLFGMM